MISATFLSQMWTFLERDDMNDICYISFTDVDIS